MNPDNTRAGRCYYCDQQVLKGTGRMSEDSGAIWHKECVGSGRHEGAYHYGGRDTRGRVFIADDDNGMEWDEDLVAQFDWSNVVDLPSQRQRCSFTPIDYKTKPLPTVYDRSIQPYPTRDDKGRFIGEGTHTTKKGKKNMNNRNPNHSAHVSGKKACFIIWCPTSSAPPVQTFDTLEEAWSVADDMARKNDGSKFLVMQSVGYSAVEKPVVRRDIITATDDKAPAKE